MSSIIPPLISNSPPPLDMTMESEDEDEFQFPNLDIDSYSCDESVIPHDFPDIDIAFDIPEIDINRNKREDKDFHDKRKSEDNSDFILPNIQEIVPNNLDLTAVIKNESSFDAEDIEVSLISERVDDLIPNINEPVNILLNSLNNLQNFDINKCKSDRDINSTPTETTLPTELNDKAISDKELSSSEPNFESFSDSSQKEHQNNTNNKSQDKSICDVDEIDDDFGDFADFNNISNSCNFAQPTENGQNEPLHFKELKNKNTDTFSAFDYNVDKEFFEAKVETTNNNSNANLAALELDIHNIDEILSSTDEDRTEFKPEIEDCDAFASENKPPTKIDQIENEVCPNDKINLINSKCTEPVPFEEPQTTVDSDDEFGEFDSCTVVPTAPQLQSENSQEPSLPTLCIDRINVDGKSKEILQMMFPEENQQEIDYVQERTEDNPVFCKIRNLTETNAITYQWSKSNAQQTLLKVLNVDIRNVLYGPGWNPSMPIFAGNLSSAPLEPQKTSLPTTTTPSSNTFKVESLGISDTQFDWANSGLTNPLDATNQKEPSLKESTIEEPPKSFDSESVNSLQFTEVTPEIIDDKSGTLTDLNEFDGFADFQAVQTLQSEPALTKTANAMFPLRETYIISNERVESNSEIVQNINNDDIRHTKIQKEIESPTPTNNVNPNGDFAEFQASLPEITLTESKLSTNRSMEYKLAIENPIEPGLLNVTESSKILQPTILQPSRVGETVVVNSAVNIAWPEPGITDDEIRKFEEYRNSKAGRIASEKVEPLKKNHAFNNSYSNVLPKQPFVDDEWSDFHNAAKELPLSIASLGKIAQQRTAVPPATIAQQEIWPNSYQIPSNIHNDFFPPPTTTGGFFPTANKISMGVRSQERFDQTMRKVSSQSHQGNLSNDDEWSDFVCHQASVIPSASNVNLRQEDWTMRGPQFNSWTSTSITPSISHSNALQFNGFNSFGRSANILNSTVKSAASVQGKNKGNVPMIGIKSKKESVPSISALPDLDFVTSASRFASGRMQQQKK